MTTTAKGPPMDVLKEAGQQHQQVQQNQKKELDRKESVRTRLLAISQVEPVGEPVLESSKTSPRPAPRPDAQDGDEEFRRKLMSISYVDAALPAQ